MNRQTHWNDVYTTRAPETVSWYQAEPERSLAYIEKAGVTHDAALIDIGGGASLLSDHLLERDYSDISVLDISACGLEHAQSRLGARAGAIHWIVSDLLAFEPSRQYDLWHDRAVLHFLTDSVDRMLYVKRLRAGLKPGGHAIFAAFAVGGPRRCSGLEVRQYDVDRLMDLLGSGFVLRDQSYEEHHTPAGNIQQFAWFLVQSSI